MLAFVTWLRILVEEARDSAARAGDAGDDIARGSGRGLRRSPVARLLFLLYVIVLHLWVFAVFSHHTHAHMGLHEAAPHAQLTHGAAGGIGRVPAPGVPSRVKTTASSAGAAARLRARFPRPAD